MTFQVYWSMKMLNLENGNFTIFTFQGKKCWRWTSKSQKWLQEIPSQLWRSHSWDGGRGRCSDGNSSIRLQGKAKSKYVHHCICLPLLYINTLLCMQYKESYLREFVWNVIIKYVSRAKYKGIIKFFCSLTSRIYATLLFEVIILFKRCAFLSQDNCCVQANKKEITRCYLHGFEI